MPNLLRALESHREAILALMRQYYAEDDYPFAEGTARLVLETFLSDESLGRLWVLVDADAVVGYLALTFGYSFEHRGRDAFIDELYVTPERRGRGLGRLLLDAAIDACAQLGVQTLHLEVERRKTKTIALYKSLGFRDNDRLLLSRPITRNAKCAPAPAVARD
jgi:ribosomal protein S18 acetylase RimI-like enzyme